MIEVAAPTRGREGDWDAPPPRPIQRRRPLPGTRAVVGALLVALAAVGLFVASTSAAARGRVHVVVATRDLAVGDRIRAGDVGLQLVELPAATRRQTFASIAELDGTLVVGPLAKGEVVQRASVLSRDRTPPFREVSLQMDAAQAKAVSPGDAVDILLTTGAGETTRTDIVAASVRVLRVGSGGQGFGSDQKPSMTFAVSSLEEVTRLVQAVHVGTVTLVRANGFADQAPSPSAGAAGRTSAP
jgi:Flp pilus assembly protein CpaB